jgi:hypothetical protein
MVGVIATSRQFFRVLSSKAFTSRILTEVVQNVVKIPTKHHSWTKTGCPIISNGQDDGKNRTLLNFLIGFPRGEMFLQSFDSFDHVKEILK